MHEPDEQNMYKVHKSCRAMFKTHISRKTSKYGTNAETVEEHSKQDQEHQATHETTKQRFKRRTLDIKDKTCFVCDLKDEKDVMSYNEGGLGRCSQESARDKLIECMKIHLEDKNNR